MVRDFFIDLNNSKASEQIVLDTFAALAPQYSFQDVSYNREYYHKGDIKAVAADGHETFIEVKQDGRIAETTNVLLEDKIHYHYNNNITKGNLHSDYEIYVVVSPQKHKAIVMDFEVLKAHCREGNYKTIPHYDQTTYAYLLPLARIEELGGIIAIVDYENNEITYKRRENL